MRNPLLLLVKNISFLKKLIPFNFFKAAAGGSEVWVDVTYEPSKLGDVRANLIVSSNVGGDYVCPLYGHCVAPRPQGPVTVKSGVIITSVPFKNVFTTSANFNYIVV